MINDNYYFLIYYSIVTLFLYLSLLFLHFYSGNSYEKKVAGSIGIILCYCIAFSMRTKQVGSDAANYVSLIGDSNALLQEMSPIIKKIAYFVRVFGGGNEQLFFFLVSILTCSVFLFAFYRFDRDNFLLMFSALVVSFMFVNVNMNLLRQGIAIGIGFLSLSYLIDRKYYLYFLCVIFSVLSHSSAVILLFPVVLLCLTRRSLVFLYLLICFIAFCIDLSWSEAIYEYKDIHWTMTRLYWYLTWPIGEVFTLRHVYIIYLVVVLIFLLIYNYLDIREKRIFLVSLSIPTVMVIFKSDDFLVNRFSLYFIPIFSVLYFKLLNVFNIRHKTFYLGWWVILPLVWLIKSIVQFDKWWIG